MKKFLIILGIVVVLLLIIALALPAIIDVNRFKPTLETDLTQALGRKVEIGNIGLSILSGGVTVDNVVIADDPAFSQTAFLQAKQLTAGVSLMPLIFSKKMEVRSFTVTEPQVSLLRSSSGAWNYSTLGSASKTKGGSASTPPNFSVEKLTISNGTIVVGTAGSHGKTQTYQNMNLEVSDLSYSSQFPIKFSAKTPGGGTISMDGKAGPIDATDTSLTPLNAKVEVKDLDLAATGFVDPSTGIGGVLDYTGNLASDGHEANSDGEVTINKLKLVAAGKPATVPVKVNYVTAYDLKKQAGDLKTGDVHIGKALAHLTGAYDIAGATTTLQMKMNGQGMYVPDLEGVLPAAGVTLPPGASLQSGNLDLNLALSGPVDKLVITGPVHLSDGKIGGFNLKSKLGALSSFSGLGGGGGGSDTEIQTLSTNVRVDPSGTQTNDLDVVVPSIGTVTGDGTVSATGQLNYKMVAKLSAGNPVGAMTTGLGMVAGGGKNNGIPFTITGTTSNPVFLPDMKAMAGSMAKGAVSAPGDVGKAASGALGGLFGKKKSN